MLLDYDFEIDLGGVLAGVFRRYRRMRIYGFEAHDLQLANVRLKGGVGTRQHEAFRVTKASYTRSL